MRRFIALFMLSILLFNSFGYRILFSFLEEEADARLIEKLDANDYSASSLVRIAVPINLPYTVEWRDFERYDGHVEIDGKSYTYVKRKVIQDSLILLCLPNPEKVRFESARDRFFELANGLKSHQPKKADTSILKILSTEYLVKSGDWQSEALPVHISIIPSFEAGVRSQGYPSGLFRPPIV